MSVRPNSSFSVEEYAHGAGKESAIMRLFRGGIRAVTGLISKRNPDQGSPLLDAFLGASVEEKTRAETARQERQQRNRRVRRIAVGILAFLAISTTCISIFAYISYQEAHRNEIMAEQASERASARISSGARLFCLPRSLGMMQ